MATKQTSGRKPNIVLFAIDSIRADHMSCYGYPRLTTPYMDRFAQGGTLFERTYSAHIPTTPAYSSMLTGMDCFSTQVVALRHRGPLRPEVRTLPEILKDAGYATSCVGFSGNAASRGFTGGRIYDALLLASAAKCKAQAVYTWNLKHYQSLAPGLARRIQTP